MLTISRNTHHRHDTTPCREYTTAIRRRLPPISDYYSCGAADRRATTTRHAGPQLRTPLVRPSVNPYRFSRKKRGRGQKKDAFGVGSVSKIKSRAVQLVASLFEDLFLRTSRWGGGSTRAFFPSCFTNCAEKFVLSRVGCQIRG